MAGPGGCWHPMTGHGEGGPVWPRPCSRRWTFKAGGLALDSEAQGAPSCRALDCSGPPASASAHRMDTIWGRGHLQPQSSEGSWLLPCCPPAAWTACGGPVTLCPAWESPVCGEGTQPFQVCRSEGPACTPLSSGVGPRGAGPWLGSPGAPGLRPVVGGGAWDPGCSTWQPRQKRGTVEHGLGQLFCLVRLPWLRGPAARPPGVCSLCLAVVRAALACFDVTMCEVLNKF